MRFPLEVPESEIATEFFAGTGDVERGKIDEGAGAVVEYELVAPGFVEFLGGVRVRHKIACGKRPFGTFRGNDVDSEGGTREEPGQNDNCGKHPFPKHHNTKIKKQSLAGLLFIAENDL
jgi:hypothetical protein